MPLWGSFSFQDCYYHIGEYLGLFHEGVMCLIVFILSVVMYGAGWVFTSGSSFRYLREAQAVETAWTIIPSVCLVCVAIPSMHLLYVMDEIGSPKFCFKAIGHQWFWSYEFMGDQEDVLGFDSFMERETDGGYRLLDVDQRMVAPANTGIRCMVSSADVIHSFALPGCMLKVDAIPGRVNEVPMTVNMCGVLYGQCSEICGANHSFMPIVIEFIHPRVYNLWHWAAVES
uniref:cytochrome c oxidase subunit II n=1 Tax=Gigantidas vrijenhoeki TaxID=2678699 RepID=UPI00226C8757|nr:cytochrome c oxidase subunit II [Gigantidas vrijenhoeki]UZG65989.1 cytochrome c oxidase subunit 2 [Gigantidas vrijenhoeki]